MRVSLVSSVLGSTLTAALASVKPSALWYQQVLLVANGYERVLLARYLSRAAYLGDDVAVLLDGGTQFVAILHGICQPVDGGDEVGGYLSAVSACHLLADLGFVFSCSHIVGFYALCPIDILSGIPY